jgi:hypothetical protein
MKSSVIWDIMLCSPVKVTWHFWGTHHLHHQGQRNWNKEAAEAGGKLNLVCHLLLLSSNLAYFSSLKMEVIWSPEMSGSLWTTCSSKRLFVYIFRYVWVCTFFVCSIFSKKNTKVVFITSIIHYINIYIYDENCFIAFPSETAYGPSGRLTIPQVVRGPQFEKHQGVSYVYIIVFCEPFLFPFICWHVGSKKCWG